MSDVYLILIRHGEAESRATSDHARELTASGRIKVRLTGARIAKITQKIGLMIVSDATRTRQTAVEVSGILPAERTVIEPLLYNANTVNDVASIITRHARPDDRVIAVVGHNPVISEVASELTGDFYAFDPGDFVIMTIDETDWATALESRSIWTAANSREVL